MNDTNPAAAPKKVLHYSLWVIGLFGRNRTKKKELVELTEVLVGFPLSPTDIEARVKAKAAELKVKPGAKLVVTCCEQTIEERTVDGVTFISRLFGVFDSQRVYEGVQA